MANGKSVIGAGGYFSTLLVNYILWTGCLGRVHRQGPLSANNQQSIIPSMDQGYLNSAESYRQLNDDCCDFTTSHLFTSSASSPRRLRPRRQMAFGERREQDGANTYNYAAGRRPAVLEFTTMRITSRIDRGETYLPDDTCLRARGRRASSGIELDNRCPSRRSATPARKAGRRTCRLASGHTGPAAYRPQLAVEAPLRRRSTPGRHAAWREGDGLRRTRQLPAGKPA